MTVAVTSSASITIASSHTMLPVTTSTTQRMWRLGGRCREEGAVVKHRASLGHCPLYLNHHFQQLRGMWPPRELPHDLQ